MSKRKSLIEKSKVVKTKHAVVFPIELGTIEMWNGTIGTVFRDSDGELGIDDEHGYSIILSKKGELQLKSILCE